jgi:thiol-disulfide isomerase/thioredoxin
MENNQNFDKSKEIIIQYLKDSALKNYISFKQIEVTYPDKVDKSIQLNGRVPKNKENDFNEFRETLFDILAESIDNSFATQFIEDSVKVDIGLSEGDKFSGIEVTDTEGKKIKIVHESGKVLMIDFWATWCVFCQEPMQENVDLMIKKDELKNLGVSIVGISCDEDSEKWKTHLNDKNWNTIPQYVRPDVRKLFGIKGIPCVAIINKEGLISYIGHPNIINLEATLKNLAEGKKIKKSEESSEKNSKWKALDSQGKMDLVAESNFTIKDAGVVNANFCIRTYYTLNEEYELIPIKVMPIFYGEVTQFEYDTLQTVATTFQDLYGLNNNFIFNTQIIDFASEDF